MLSSHTFQDRAENKSRSQKQIFMNAKAGTIRERYLKRVKHGNHQVMKS